MKPSQIVKNDLKWQMVLGVPSCLGDFHFCLRGLKREGRLKLRHLF